MQTKILTLIVLAYRCHQTKPAMTESDVDVMASATSELKGNSRLIVLLGSPEGITATTKKLRMLPDVEKIRKGLFIVHNYSENHDKALQSQPLLSFIKTKEIPSRRKNADNTQSSRVFTIASFSFKNPTAQQKKRVERLIRKTTGVRLRPGVILFPLLRSKERRRIIGTEEQQVLIDSKEFTSLISKFGGYSNRWSRLKITNSEAITHVNHAVENTFMRDIQSLEEKIRDLRERSKDPTISVRRLKKNYMIQSRSFRELKTKWMLAKKLWLYDAEKILKRTYNMLIGVRRAITLEEARRIG
ncbi:MAG: hypothetical protein ACFFFK_00055 [Candidatus Thorarchaeota archaeon]